MADLPAFQWGACWVDQSDPAAPPPLPVAAWRGLRKTELAEEAEERDRQERAAEARESAEFHARQQGRGYQDVSEILHNAERRIAAQEQAENWRQRVGLEPAAEVEVIGADPPAPPGGRVGWLLEVEPAIETARRNAADTGMAEAVRSLRVREAEALTAQVRQAEADLLRAARADRMREAARLDQRLQNLPYGSTRGAVNLPPFGAGPDLLAHLGQYHKSHPGDADPVGFHDELHRESRIPVPHRHVDRSGG